MKHMILPVKQKGTIRPGYFFSKQTTLIFVGKNNFFRYYSKLKRGDDVLQFEHKNNYIFTHLLKESYGAKQLVWRLLKNNLLLYISCTIENRYWIMNKIYFREEFTYIKSSDRIISIGHLGTGKERWLILFLNLNCTFFYIWLVFQIRRSMEQETFITFFRRTDSDKDGKMELKFKKKKSFMFLKSLSFQEKVQS